MFLFVTPSAMEVDFFKESCVSAELKNFSILSTDYNVRDESHVSYFRQNFRGVDHLQEFHNDLANEILKFYGMTASQILGVDRTLPESLRRLNEDESFRCLSYFLFQYERILTSNKISAIYTGCGPEVVRLISYFWACEFNVPIYMHAYFGVKNKIVYFDNPIKYNLMKFNFSGKDFVGEELGFVKLDPEYINEGFVSELGKIYKKISITKLMSANKTINAVKTLIGNAFRNYRYDKRLKNGSLASLEDVRKIKNKKILLPLHLYDDFVLTVLNRSYIKQFDTVSRVLAALEDKGWTLVVKEHPADICGKKIRQYEELESAGAIFCDPYLDSTEVLRECDALLTICSTYAIESMIESKPVVILGNSFYRQFDFCYSVVDIADELMPQLDSIDRKSFLNKVENFKLALDLLERNSFEAPLPYLGGGLDAVNYYANSIKEISKTLELIKGDR